MFYLIPLGINTALLSFFIFEYKLLVIRRDTGIKFFRIIYSTSGQKESPNKLRAGQRHLQIIQPFKNIASINLFCRFVPNNLNFDIFALIHIKIGQECTKFVVFICRYLIIIIKPIYDIICTIHYVFRINISAV